MKFINREKELEYLNEAKSLSHSKLYTISLHGLRRVGKTRLILEFLNNKGLYLFVNKDKTSESLLREYEEALKSIGVIKDLESIKDWETFFRILFERGTGAFVFDEFQNFSYVERSVFGILQKHIDLNEDKKDLLLLFCGSTIGLMKRLFADAKEPLYGRMKRQIYLKPLTFSNTVKICKELNIKDISEVIELYAIFGGFPRYYVAIEDENLAGKPSKDILEKFFFAENAIFEHEVAEVLSLEFGKRSGLYYDILTAIANGGTRISEIASFLEKKETVITRQINELVHYFDIVSAEKQAVGNKKNLFINHPLLNFWFKIFYKRFSAYKRRDKQAIKKIKEDINSHIGRQFEEVCKEYLKELNNKKKLFFSYENIGKQWGKMHSKPKDKNQYEVDIVALNEETKEILFGECKWQEKVNASKVLNDLKEKSKYVEWHNEGRKEYFVVFAKNFKEKIKEKNTYLFDLKDMKMAFE